MKHTAKKGIILLAILCAICVPAFSLTGTVVSVTGKVELQSGSGWAPLRSGDTIESGLIISTGFRAQAVLQVAGSNIVVNQLTRLTLEQLTETNDSHESEVFLDLGSINADVQRAQNKRVGFVVNTPVATASVRGTSFYMTRNTLSVSSGSIDFSGLNGKTVSVPAGNSSKVTPTGKPLTPFINKVNETLGVVADAENEDVIPSITDTTYKAVETTREAEPSTTSVVVVFSAP